MTGRVTLHGIRDVDHHWTGRIDDVVALTELSIVPLAAEGHGETWCAALSSRLYPHHAARASISFQCWNGCRVRGDEIRHSRVIPVKNDYPVIAEVDRRQVCWRKLSVSMPGSSDGVLNKGRAPRVVRLEQREVIRSGLADRKRVLNRVAGELRAPGVPWPALGQP